MSSTLLIARYTFKEVIQSKVLWGIFLLGIINAVLTFVVTEFSYGAPQKVSIDLGLGTISLSLYAMAIFFGVSLISKEVETRTVYMLLSRPVSRLSYLLGRCSGLALTFVLSTFIISLFSMSYYLVLGGNLDGLLFWILTFKFFEAIIALLIVLLFSLLVNTTLSVIFGFFTLLIGHALGPSQELVFVKNNPILREIINVLTFILPDFQRISFEEFLIYEETVPSNVLWTGGAYAATYCLFLILICYITFNYKNLD